jgi:hypothetical protein
MIWQANEPNANKTSPMGWFNGRRWRAGPLKAAAVAAEGRN